MSPVRSRSLVSAAALLGLMVASPCLAQSPDLKPVTTATRASLSERARIADSLGRRDEAFVIRTRLSEGDFQVGDRILAMYDGTAMTKTDTLVVQTGRVIHLGEPMGDLTVAGLLRNELADSMSARVNRLFKQEDVRLVPLLRLSIAGPVASPGSHYVRADVPLTDVITRFAGPAPAADMERTTIRRGDALIWGSEDVRAALADGLTLERLDLAPGDEIVVGTRQMSNKWMLAAQIGVPIITAIIIQFVVRR
jgi:hypothetical protein